MEILQQPGYLPALFEPYWVAIVVMAVVLTALMFFLFSKASFIIRARDLFRDNVLQSINNNGETEAFFQQCSKSGFLCLFRQSKLYWVCTIITAILCYGFALTNYTMLADDLGFDNLFGNHVVLAADRWGYVVLMRVFNTLMFLPYWRAFIGICFIVVGATIFCGLYRKHSNGRFDSKTATIFTCIAISFPWIAEIFMLTTATISFGVLVTLTGTSLFFTCKWLVEKKHFLYIIPGALVLGWAIAFYEPAVVLFMAGGFTMVFSYFLYSSEKRDFRRVLIMSLQIIAVSLIGILIWKVGAILLQSLLSVERIDYTDSFSRHNTTGFAEFIKSITLLLLRFIKHRVMPPIGDTFVSMIIWCATVLLILIGTTLSVLLRKPSLFIAAIAAAGTSYGMYFALGSPILLHRITFTFFLVIAFTSALLYMVFRDIVFKRFKMKYLVVFLVIWIVFIQSREMNQVYHLDYQRYQRDIMVMNTLVHDLGLEQEKPVLFIGLLPDPLPKREFAGISIFNINRTSAPYEFHFGDINNFFRAHYFPEPGSPDYFPPHGPPGGDIDKDVLHMQIADIPGWPENGYIKEFEDYIIVRLGASQWD